MHPQHHARPPSAGNPHLSHHQQQQSQYPMPPQALQMAPQIPQRVSMPPQQQRPPSQDQVLQQQNMQQSAQQQNQQNSYLASSAEDLSDLEAILSQT